MPEQLRAWARPTLAIAAALLAVVWTGALLAPGAPPRPSAARRAARWAAGEEPLSTMSILSVLGGADGQR